MSSPKPDAALVQKLKSEYGELVQVEFGELGWYLLRCFNKDTYGDYIDRATADRENATARCAARAVLYPDPTHYAVARQRKPRLPSTIVGLLCEAAGIPRGDGSSSADTWDTALTTSTPPADIDRAGLPREQLERILADITDRELTLFSVSDRAGKVIFGGVLAAPTDVESGMVSDLKKRKKGLQLGMKSIVESCLVWSRDPFVETIERYPAIVTVLMEHLADRLEVADTVLFRP